MLFLLFFQVQGFAQTVIIPRDGFPYCEPFTNSSFRSGTVLGLSAKSTAPSENIEGEGFLRLTENIKNDRGYAFIDLPFSSAYGIKVAFEYFAYGGNDPLLRADGLSFFLFDGNIKASDFRIGGLGGSLGYAPHKYSTETIPKPGLKGAYFGLGFDSFKNFGNEYEGKRGGFASSTPNKEEPGSPPDSKVYPNSIVIRAPESDKYKFFDGKRTNNFPDPDHETIDVFGTLYDQDYLWTDGSVNNPLVTKSQFRSRRFTISSPNRALDCSQEGYRKVFIELQPAKFPKIGFDITVYMIVNTDAAPTGPGGLNIETIFKGVNYPYPSFSNLKMGFAASTGEFTAFHEIRNVTAEVFETSKLIQPTIAPIPPKEICVDAASEYFEFNAQTSSLNSFIRCVQLNKNLPPVPSPPAPPKPRPTLPEDCGYNGGICDDLCDPSKKEEVEVNGGKFEVELIPDPSDPTGEKQIAKIKFIPAQDFVGEAVAYVQVLDNYGYLSKPQKITAIVNPYPFKSQNETIDLFPSCDGQSDGKLSGLVVSDLVEKFDYYWTYKDLDGNVKNIGKGPAPTNKTSPVERKFSATFSLDGLNVGTYFLNIWNPSFATQKCEIIIPVEVLLETGTPVEIDAKDKVICEGESVSFLPSVSNSYNSTGVPKFLWYSEADKRPGSKLTATTSTIDGVPVQVTIAANGMLTVKGLTSSGAGVYDFFVEVESKVEPTGKFCPYVGDIPSTSKATVTVFPELQTSFTATPDWCRTSAGTISVTAQGGTGSKTFSLYLDGNNNPLATQVVNGNSHTFTGLFPGKYEVEVSTKNPTCTKIIGPITIEGPALALALSPVSTENSYCGGTNGSLKFSLSGGNPLAGNPLYTISIVPQNPTATITSSSGNTYTVTGLAAGSYTITATDAERCSVSIPPMTVVADPPSVFGTTKDEICEGEVAIVSPTGTLSSGVPVYTWYDKDGGGNYVQITNGTNPSGVTFAIDGSNKLSVSNLAPRATPYTYYLKVSYPKECGQGYIPAEILVNPKPIPAASLITQVTCNGAADGVIQAQLGSGNLADFEYSLIGNNGVNRPFTKNSGLFNALPPGTYELKIKSAKGCEATVKDLIVTQPSVLVVNEVSKKDATCGTNNGEIRFKATGATPDGAGKYSIKVNGADISTFGSNLTSNGPGDFTLLNLAPGPFKIEVQDTKGCKKELAITIQNTPTPIFDAQDVIVCEGTNAVLTPQVVSNTIGAIPVYTWSYENLANPGQYIPINTGDVVNGVTYTLSNGVLTIKGLKYAVPNYKYRLSVTGTNVCPAAPILAEVKVLKIPTAVFQTVSVSCFGGTNGQIKLTSVDPTGSNTFTLIETGESNSTGNFSNLKAGTYTIRIKESGSPCQSESKLVITEPSKLELLNPLKSDATCGQLNGSISFDVKGGVKDYQILINGNPISAYSFNQIGDKYAIKNLAPATYSVQVTDANLCVVNKPDLFILKNDDGLTVTVNPLKDEKCVGSSVVLNPVFSSALPVVPTLKWYKDAGLLQPITSSAIPDSDNITYLINPSGVLTINGLQVGDYKYFLEISGPGICTVQKEANVKIIPQIVADIIVENITCFGQKDGSISVTPSGGNGKFEIRLNGGAYSANTVFSNLGAGNYTVDIRNDLGCVTTYPLEVKSPAGPIVINKPSIIRASCDLDNGRIEDLVISGGWNSYEIEWRFGSATGPIIPGDLTGAQNLAPGTYFLLVSDLEGCPTTFTFVIGESSDPVYAVVPPINSCLGSKVSIRPIHIAPNPTLPPAAATEVQWYTGPGQTGLISNGTDPVISGVTYFIDDTDWLNPLLEVAGLPVGLHDFYFFVVCTGQEIKVETTVYSTPEVIFETDPITCFGDKNGKIRIISGDQAIYNYSINSAPAISKSALEAMSFGAGSYDLVISTPAGCSQTLKVIVDGPSAALSGSPLTKIDPTCGASNGKLELKVTGGWLPYTLDIFKDGVSSGTQVFSKSDISIGGFRPGVYLIKITDAKGCTLTTNSVSMEDGPTRILLVDAAVCEGSNALLVPSLDPAASGADFQWFFNKALTLPIVSSPNPAADGNIYQINPTSGILTVSGLASAPSLYTYYVTASGSTVCPGYVGEGKIRVYGNPTASASVQNEVCFGDGGQITINASGGSGGYTYSINGGAFVTSNVFKVSVGTYTVEVRTLEGCSYILNNIIVSGPSAALAIKDIEQNNPSCELNNGDIRFTISGGYSPYTINYTGNGVSVGSSPAGLDGKVIISGIGVGTYSFTVTDKQGCKINLTNALVFTEVPTEITIAADEICEGETAELIPSVSKNIIDPKFMWYFDADGKNPVSSGTVNGVTYTINPSGALSASGLAPNAFGHILYVSASGIGICGLVPKPVRVLVNTIPNLKVSNPSVVCDPKGSVDLTNFIEGFNPAVYDYNVLNPSGSVMRLEDIASAKISGDYRVSSSLKGKGCWNQAQRIRVIISDTLLETFFEYQVDLGGGLFVNNGDIQIQELVKFGDLSKGKIILWEWNFGDGSSSSDQNPTHSFMEKGVYTVTLKTTDQFGCESLYEILVKVSDDFRVMVPTAFTPDGLKNKYFKPYHRGISSMEFYIFNTWGELIYESKSLEDIGWDGTLNGTPTPNGNYVYKGRFESRSGEVFTKSGVFILIR